MKKILTILIFLSAFTASLSAFEYADLNLELVNRKEERGKNILTLRDEEGQSFILTYINEPDKNTVKDILEQKDRIYDMKSFKIKQLVIAYSEVITEFHLTVNSFSYMGKTYKENFPAGLMFFYERRSMRYDFRVKSGAYFVRVDGVFDSASGLYKQLYDVINDPKKYLQNNSVKYAITKINELNRELQSVYSTALNAERSAEAVRSEMESRIGQTEQKLEGRISEVDAKVDKSTSELKSSFDEKISSLDSSLSGSISSLRSELNSKIDKNIKSLEEKLTAHIETVKSDLENEIDMLRSDLLSYVNRTRDKLAMSIEKTKDIIVDDWDQDTRALVSSENWGNEVTEEQLKLIAEIKRKNPSLDARGIRGILKEQDIKLRTKSVSAALVAIYGKENPSKEEIEEQVRQEEYMKKGVDAGVDVRNRSSTNSGSTNSGSTNSGDEKNSE